MQWLSGFSSTEFQSVFVIQTEVGRVALTQSDAGLSLLELWLVESNHSPTWSALKVTEPLKAQNKWMHY